MAAGTVDIRSLSRQACARIYSLARKTQLDHAQDVSLAANHLGFPALIVMPVTTPSIKIDAVAALGGEVIIEGATFDDASAHAEVLAKDRGYAFIHPFDDPHVIAGQSTVALEILDQLNEQQLSSSLRARSARQSLDVDVTLPS